MNHPRIFTLLTKQHYCKLKQDNLLIKLLINLRQELQDNESSIGVTKIIVSRTTIVLGIIQLYASSRVRLHSLNLYCKEADVNT